MEPNGQLQKVWLSAVAGVKMSVAELKLSAVGAKLSASEMWYIAVPVFQGAAVSSGRVVVSYLSGAINLARM
jgi:hypothetical protein